jgi:hypothetical protein
MGKDVQKILETFRLKHVAHRLDCQKYYETCPICQIIVEEQTDKYVSAIEESFRLIVSKHCTYWDQNGYAIANDTQPEVLSGTLAYNAFERWLQPVYHEIEMTDEELFRHSYVQQKIMEN